MKKPYTLILSTTLVLTLLSNCSHQCIIKKSEKGYLNKSSISANILTKPSTIGSKEWQKEIVHINKIQKNISKPEIKKIQQEQILSPDLVANVIGKNFTRENYPLSYKLLDRSDKDCKNIVDNAKIYWHKKRPYETAPKAVKNLISSSNANTSFSYPSGHTACSIVYSKILTQLFPQKANLLNAKANNIAFHRIEAGMHYPSDIEAGKEMGLLIFGSLQQSNQYRFDLKKAEKEIHIKQKNIQ